MTRKGKKLLRLALVLSVTLGALLFLAHPLTLAQRRPPPPVACPQVCALTLETAIAACAQSPDEDVASIRECVGVALLEFETCLAGCRQR
jgi:hypothetical protein